MVSIHAELYITALTLKQYFKVKFQCIADHDWFVHVSTTVESFTYHISMIGTRYQCLFCVYALRYARHIVLFCLWLENSYDYNNNS